MFWGAFGSVAYWLEILQMDCNLPRDTGKRTDSKEHPTVGTRCKYRADAGLEAEADLSDQPEGVAEGAEGWGTAS